MQLKWHDALDLGLEGQGWSQTAKPYSRLPNKAQQMTMDSDAVWNLSFEPTGLCVHFQTDAETIHARWTLTNPPNVAMRETRTAINGLDLYGEIDGQWRWVAAVGPDSIKNRTLNMPFREKIDAAMRRYRVYLPIGNPIESLELGVPEGAAFEPVAPRTEKPIAYYGTSIVHGHHASRPGMPHCQQLGRRLNKPMLNLGFSGNAKMELDLAKLFTELDPVMWIIDPLPNMHPDLVAERSEPFVATLRNARPDTPIVLVEDRMQAHATFDTPLREHHQRNRAALRATYEKLAAAGDENLHYINHTHLIGLDGEGTTDGSHPTDLGFYRYADAMEPTLRQVLSQA